MDFGRLPFQSRGVQPWLWLLAVLLFGVGDVVSTAAGLFAGGVEANPVVVGAVDRYGIVAVVLLKGVVFGLCYAVWRHAPELYRAGIPAALATVGAAVTGWNLAVLSVLLRA
ncbi:hypothetical protein [Natronomonas marina]|jgi:hypothetical protein|uniref:hypothetical protein n=1 Tax=Natronomonas marina TaxID=2961939 RepID=UPI0020C970E5|nr:hypothetical protein [Natronomonas marina]